MEINSAETVIVNVVEQIQFITLTVLIMLVCPFRND